VNLIGYPRAEMGLGEDIRSVAKALKSQDIPFCIIDVGLGKGFSQNDTSVKRWISDRPLYGINLFCQNGVETAKYLAKKGRGLTQGRYSIGLWPWELPEWPESCRHAYACIDEIWGISAFTANAYSSFPGPVRTMTLPVTTDELGPQGRRDFGLSEEAYLYLFSFDLHSKTARKNPFGLIEAFQKAFPRDCSERVGLVLKVHHAKRFHPDAIRLRWIAKRDPRIHLIEHSMRRPEVLALTKACDCYVSLHRAEGFGRGIAEAILLGRQVIATGYSGNTDFCHEPRVVLVRSEMIPLKRGEYFYGNGQLWAEPDIRLAAELMCEIRHQPRDVSSCSHDFSPATVGARYAKRLNEIWEEFAHDSPCDSANVRERGSLQKIHNLT
jgi:glycosyltransferase involved in cell wall biosynthesis